MSFLTYQRQTPLSATRLHVALFGVCIVLTVVLYLKGGATNPFVSLYLVPIAVSAAALSARFTASLTIFCLLAYSLLVFYYQPLQILSPHDEMIMPKITLQSDEHQMHVMASEEPNWHVVGMWMNFGFSALLITWFVTRMAHSLRVQAAELSTIREKQLRNEQLLAIATLAAGTMHELGTPLATMTLLSEDLKSNVKDHPELAEDARLLSEQVKQCKLILQNLASAAEHPSGQEQTIAINHYLDRVLTHWQLLNPAIRLENNFNRVDGFIRADSTLEQAFINLLNNAAEASPTGIELSILQDKTTTEITICIRDYGAGIHLASEQLGKPFVSTRGQGRGLGLFLSNATIERLGGRVILKPHSEGGTLTAVTLPYQL
jgi:two-component system, sensor histidine kinase RegB